MIELANVIRARRTIHLFKATPVSEEVVHQALELALWAPNHRLTMPWRFTKIGPQARASLAGLSVQLKAQAQGGGLADDKSAAVKADFMRASHLIAVALPKVADPAQGREDYAAVAAGLQNAALYLWSLGIGTKWSTGAVTCHATTYEILGVDPGAEELVGFFWVGFPERTPAAAPRPKLNSVLREIP